MVHKSLKTDTQNEKAKKQTVHTSIRNAKISLKSYKNTNMKN